ncbi:MAG: pyridoxal-dependent decarboxylase, exosortase A system-associated [Rhodocyclaceae bacterium]|nr:pyridoxal-dependent decarboxylase, exosortase A system-associated [Rhodocyclaceae bacterium]
MTNKAIDQVAIDWPCADGQLLLGGRTLDAVAAELGSDAFYAYDRGRMEARVAALRRALPPCIGLHYAVKANPLPELVTFMASLVDGLDVASRREMQLALNSGMRAASVSYAGPGKGMQDLRDAVAAGILINVESPREIERLAQIAAETGQTARIAVRVNPAFELRGAGMRMGGGAKPFGIDEEALPALLPTLQRPGLRFEGFHLYCGSQSLNASAIAESLQQGYALALRLAAWAPAPVLSLNLGGGLGIPYFPGERPLDLAPIAAALDKIATDAAMQMPQARLHLELGRYLVGEAGIYATRIVDRKVSRGETFLITAGGMNHHLAASGNLGQVIRKNYPVVIGNRLEGSELERVHIHGPLCTPLDVLAQGVVLPRAEPGDWVVVFQSGAYGYSASPHGFLSQPLPSEILT